MVFSRDRGHCKRRTRGVNGKEEGPSGTSFPRCGSAVFRAVCASPTALLPNGFHPSSAFATFSPLRREKANESSPGGARFSRRQRQKRAPRTQDAGLSTQDSALRTTRHSALGTFPSPERLLEAPPLLPQPLLLHQHPDVVSDAVGEDETPGVVPSLQPRHPLGG